MYVLSCTSRLIHTCKFNECRAESLREIVVTNVINGVESRRHFQVGGGLLFLRVFSILIMNFLINALLLLLEVFLRFFMLLNDLQFTLFIHYFVQLAVVKPVGSGDLYVEDLAKE